MRGLPPLLFRQARQSSRSFSWKPSRPPRLNAGAPTIALSPSPTVIPIILVEAKPTPPLECGAPTIALSPSTAVIPIILVEAKPTSPPECGGSHHCPFAKPDSHPDHSRGSQADPPA